jgi:hypothetical protein
MNTGTTLTFNFIDWKISGELFKYDVSILASNRYPEGHSNQAPPEYKSRPPYSLTSEVITDYIQKNNSELQTRHEYRVTLSYPCERPCRPTELWDVQARTFSRQSVHRWQWGCQPCVPAALYPQEDSWYSFLLKAESIPGPYCGWKD